jgi:hypothetical protein
MTTNLMSINLFVLIPVFEMAVHAICVSVCLLITFRTIWLISIKLGRNVTTMLGESLVTTAWRVLRLRMEGRPPDTEGSCEYIE